MTREERDATYVRNNTALLSAPLVPEIDLYLADDSAPLWRQTAADLETEGIREPFWAFAWAGGQALARFVLDEAETVHGKRILDFAAGSGIAAIAAMKAGATFALAADIDPLAAVAAKLNAEANGVNVSVTTEDFVGRRADGFDVILAGDICYEQPLAGKVRDWLREQASFGCVVLVGDPGRSHLPQQELEQVRAYGVRTTRELDDTDVRNARVWRFKA